MYIFRIVDMVSRTKAWYRGEYIAPNLLDVPAIAKPPGYPLLFSAMSTYTVGDSVERLGYIYESLKNNNIDLPEINYVGSPLKDDNVATGRNSWLRTDYALATKMCVAESGGITEGYGASLSGTLKLPEEEDIATPSSFFEAPESATCVLFCGVIAGAANISSYTISGLDVNAYEPTVGNPETSAINTAITLSLDTYPPAGFSWTLHQSTKASSTYCSGAYIGTWSYIGKTQWTDHKKNINDYSRQEQDVWGNYSLSKRRTGRTYSAEVLLTPNKNAAENDYDYTIESLCFSVHQLLQTVLGRCAAFYFNNQNIGCPWISEGVEAIVKLEDTDIIVGVLQSFSINDITSDSAKLTISVNSVPNEYKNYSEQDKGTIPDAPAVENLSSVSFMYYMNLRTDLALDPYDTIEITAGESLQPTIEITADPITAPFMFYAITKLPLEMDDPSKIPPEDFCEWTVVPYSDKHQKITVWLKGKEGQESTQLRGFNIVFVVWGESNTYEYWNRQFFIKVNA